VIEGRIAIEMTNEIIWTKFSWLLSFAETSAMLLVHAWWTWMQNRVERAEMSTMAFMKLDRMKA